MVRLHTLRAAVSRHGPRPHPRTAGYDGAQGVVCSDEGTTAARAARFLSYGGCARSLGDRETRAHRARRRFMIAARGEILCTYTYIRVYTHARI